jgi:hypothetical protein
MAEDNPGHDDYFFLNHLSESTSDRAPSHLGALSLDSTNGGNDRNDRIVNGALSAQPRDLHIRIRFQSRRITENRVMGSLTCFHRCKFRTPDIG